MTRVLHVVERWLDLSAGFVAAHVAHSRHEVVVVATKGRVKPTAFPHRPVYSLAATDRLPISWQPRAVGRGVDVVGVARRCDVVHVHFGYPAHAALSLVRRHRLPLVLSLHGKTLAVHWRSGNAWLNLNTTTWKTSPVRASSFPWLWLVVGLAAAAALAAAGGMARRRRAAGTLRVSPA